MTYGMVLEVRKLLTNYCFASVAQVYCSVVPRGVQPHNMISMTMGEEKHVLGQVIPHVLEIVNPDIGLQNVRHFLLSKL